MDGNIHNGLTVLSFGARQDSTCLLYKIIRDQQFREKWINGQFIVVFSNTGNEHPHTYRHLGYVRQLCQTYSIPFFILDAKMGYHPKTWKSLTHQFRRNNTIMSLMFPRTCTDNLKIKPIYNFLDHYIAKTCYGYTANERPKGKKFIKRFAAKYGKVRIILGIAAGEEKRIEGSKKRKLQAAQLNLFEKPKTSQPIWMCNTVEKVYPLLAEGLDRTSCQQYIRQTGWQLPYPSNCIFCPFISKPEVLWMYRNLPERWTEWVELEDAKIRCNGASKKNHGVKGEKRLSEILQEAITEFGHMCDEELDDYKMNHGHCVMSSF